MLKRGMWDSRRLFSSSLNSAALEEEEKARCIMLEVASSTGVVDRKKRVSVLSSLSFLLGGRPEGLARSITRLEGSEDVGAGIFELGEMGLDRVAEAEV